MLLNLDAGEYDDEPPELYRLADLVHVACGGHAGDEASMKRVVSLCPNRIGAHPSYVDRDGFGRRRLEVPPAVLADQIEAQCAALAALTTPFSVKPHGALYHAAHADVVVADALLDGVTRALGRVRVVGPAGGALERVARARGHAYLREAFADRGVRADGTLVPRGEPGALVSDATVAATRARDLAASNDVETICVHADTPNALAIARAVRAALDAR